MVLEAIYEQDFLPCSFGFRPCRSAHQALQALRTGFMSHGLRWVIDLDIEKYFDSISHSHLRAFLDRRVTDGVIRRMIDKWLKAGVLEDGLLRHATEGSPQGGVSTPLTQKVTWVVDRRATASRGRSRSATDRRSGWRGDRVPNDDFVIGDQDFFHEELHDTLAL